MPMKTIVGFRVLVSSCLCLAALFVAAAPARAVIGGTATSITNVPWQVGLVPAGASASAQFCGGSLLEQGDSSPVIRVVTAAHCVIDPVTGLAKRPGDLEVLAGKSKLSGYPAAPDGLFRMRVTAVSFSPLYDDVTGDRDVAVLTLDTAGVGPAVGTPIELATTATALPSTGRISGWGASAWGPNASDQVYPDNVIRADVNIHSDPTCSSDYGASFKPSTMLCAGDAAADACFGDSGGPLAVQSGTTWLLAGVTSFGVGCGDAAHPGVYGEVAEAFTRTYLLSRPPPAPVATSAPAVLGTAQAGQVLTCSPGGWTGGPGVAAQFVKTANGTTITLTASGPGRTYVPTAADVGWQVVCLVKATNGGGWARARSAATAPVAAAPVVTPTPTTTPTPTPQPTPAPAPRDVTAPKARFARATCSRKRCVVDLRVTDRGYSAGVKGVISSVTSSVKRPCRRHGRRTTCTRKVKRSLRAVRRGKGRYRVTLTRPSRGPQRFAAVAVDRAGNRQLKPAVKTIRVK